MMAGSFAGAAVYILPLRVYITKLAKLPRKMPGVIREASSGKEKNNEK